MRTLSQIEVEKNKTVLINNNYYDTIKDEIIRRGAIYYDVAEDNENEK